jgi:hypothetical protein
MMTALSQPELSTLSVPLQRLSISQNRLACHHDLDAAFTTATDAFCTFAQ